MDKVTLVGAAVLFLGAASYAAASMVPAGFSSVKTYRSRFNTAGFLLSMLGMLIMAMANPM